MTATINSLAPAQASFPLFGGAGQPMLTLVDDDELVAREGRRVRA